MATDYNSAGQLVDRKGQEWQERSVVVKQGPEGFGFTISKQYPVFVEGITPGGPADEAGIRQGDRIIRVNGKDAVSLEHQKVVEMIRDSSVVSLTVLAKLVSSKNTLGVEITPPRQLQDISPQSLKVMLQRQHKSFEALSVEYSRTCNATLEKELMDCESLIKILETEIAQKSHAVEAFIETTQNNVATLTGRKRTPTHRSASFMDERLNKLARRAEEEGGERRVNYSSSVSPTKGLSKAVTTPALLANGTVSPVKKHCKMVPVFPANNEDLDSDDNDQDFQQDYGATDQSPFNSMQELKNSPAHMAAFLTYLFNNRDPKYLLFHLVANSYKTVCKATELKSRGIDIWWTFVLLESPLCLNLSDSIAGRIADTLESEENEHKLRNVFVEARESLNSVLIKDLASFREKRTLGLSWMFGDKQMSNKMTPKEELDSINAILLPTLNHCLDDRSATTSEEIMKNQAIAASLVTFLHDVYEKHDKKGDLRAANSQIERVQGFTRPEKRKHVKKKLTQCGHSFQLTTFRKPTLCRVCKKPLWGVVHHGYQCSVCDYTVHHYFCISDVSDVCQKKNRKPSLVSIVLQPATEPEPEPTVHPMDPPAPLPPASPSPPLHGTSNMSQSEDELQASCTSTDQAVVIGVSVQEPELTNSSGRPRSISDPDFVHNQVIPLTAPDERYSPDGKHPGRDTTHARVSRTQSDRQAKKPESLVFTISTALANSLSSTSSFEDPPFSAVPSASSTLFRPLDTLMEYDGVHDDMKELMESNVEDELIPWALTAKREVVQSLKRYQIERQELIKELVYTERTHLQKLNLMKYMYKIPLQRQSVLTPQQLEQLFPSLEELILFHGGLCADLKERISMFPDGVVKSVADVLLLRFDGAAGQRLCHACSVFASNQINAERLFKEWKAKNDKFRNFVLKAENSYLSHRLTFNELIPIAWQRLTKYKLLIEQMNKTYKKHTEELDAFDKEEAEKLSTAITCVQGILHYVNKQVRRAGNRQRLAAYQTKLDTSALERTSHPIAQLYKTLDLTAEDRVLLYEGALTIRLYNKKTIELYALLLTDIIVLMERRNDDKDKYYLRCHMLESIHGGTRVELSPIIRLRESLLRHSAADRGNRTFFVVNNSPAMKLAQMYQFIAEGPHEKKQWEEAITDAMSRAATGGRVSPPEHLPSDDLPANMSAGFSNIHSHMDLREQLNKIDEDMKKLLTEKIVILRAMQGGVHIPLEPYRQRDTKPSNTPKDIMVTALEQVGEITDTVSRIMVPNPTKSIIAETQTRLKDTISELEKTLSRLMVSLGEQPIQHRLPRVPETLESTSDTSSAALKDQYSLLETFAERNSRALMPEELELTGVRGNLPLSPMTLSATDPESPSKEDDVSAPLFSDHTSEHNWQEKNSTATSEEPFSFDIQMPLDEGHGSFNVSMMQVQIVTPPDSFSGESPFVPAPTPHSAETEEANPDLLRTPVPSPTQSGFSNPFVSLLEQQIGKPAKSATADEESNETFMTESVLPLVRTYQVSGSSIKTAQQPGLIVNSQLT